jgi:hypothetical protein
MEELEDYYEALMRVSKHEENLKVAKEDLAIAEKNLNLVMVMDNIDSLLYKGLKIEPSVTTHVSCLKENQAELFEQLRENDLGDLITEQVHHKRLGKMYLELKDDETYDSITSLLNVYEVPSISKRKVRG